jgi:hypothetical protein
VTLLSGEARKAISSAISADDPAQIWCVGHRRAVRRGVEDRRCHRVDPDILAGDLSASAWVKVATAPFDMA